MGQLERYGLYVLCVVIFLILGVALWGDDPALAHTSQTGTVSQVAALGNEVAPPTNAPDKPAPEKHTKPVNSALDALREQFAGGSETDPRSTDSRLDDEPLTARPDGAKKADPKSGVAPKVDPETKSDVKKPEVKDARPAAGPGEYTIQAGDNLESIAAAKLGNARAWNDIVKANPGLDVRRLAIGAKIKLPARAVPTPTVKAALAANEYEIKAGDTLEKIAKATLGKETRWREIHDANPKLNPSRLQPGTRIKLPSKPTDVSANR
jgi:nucleoid-associated protein YgaU